MIEPEAVCIQIKSDIDKILLEFINNTDVTTRQTLEYQIVAYLKNVKDNGLIYKIPKVIIENRSIIYTRKKTTFDGQEYDQAVEIQEPNVISLAFYDHDTGKKIEALDELVTPFSRYSSTEDGGIL